MYRQIALYDAKDWSLFDVKRLVYSLLLANKQGRYSNNLIVERGLEIIFKAQLDTGLLPIGHVVDNDFVILDGVVKKQEVSASPLLSSYECFNDLLSNSEIRTSLKKYQTRLGLAYDWAFKRLRKDPKTGCIAGWYPEYESTHTPISWVTGHTLLFIKKYCELLSELISESASRYLQATRVDEIKLSNTYFVKENVDCMKSDEYRSALVFGPPGTGKSTIAKYLAHNLNYQFVELIPGQFLTEGSANIIPRAYELFKRLMKIRNAVIFFDEVDQFVKKRPPKGQGDAEPVWIVTALLPKFAELRRRKDIRFMLATNLIDVVDTAISRPGRIDLILPMGGISWRDRVRILKETIESLPDSVKNELPEPLTVKNDSFLSKMTSSGCMSQECCNPVLKEQIDIIEKHDFVRECPRLVTRYLRNTNYLSYLRIKQILEQIFRNSAGITRSRLYQEFFEEEPETPKFEDNELRDFQVTDLVKPSIKSKIRWPAQAKYPEGVNTENIIRENIYD